MSDTGKLVHDLLLLVFELQAVGEFLPGAAAAVAVMFAERLHAVGRRCLDAHEGAFHIFLPALVDAHVDDVPRHCVGYEYYFPVNAGNGLAFGSDRFYSHAADYFLFFFLSAHTGDKDRKNILQIGIYLRRNS